jgi:hypothetical protein
MECADGAQLSVTCHWTMMMVRWLGDATCGGTDCMCPKRKQQQVRGRTCDAMTQVHQGGTMAKLVAPAIPGLSYSVGLVVISSWSPELDAAEQHSLCDVRLALFISDGVLHDAFRCHRRGLVVCMPPTLMRMYRTNRLAPRAGYRPAQLHSSTPPHRPRSGGP